MIGYLNGKIIDADGPMITLLVGGIGFNVMMPNNGAMNLTVGDEIGIYTYMHVRENDIGLYGFTDTMEKEVFNLLIGVSGVGPKSAMQMLGVADAKSIVSAIVHEDEKMLSSLPGIGKKTSARLILELKEKVEKQFPHLLSNSPVQKLGTAKKKESAIEKDLTDALVALGYHSSEIKNMVEETDVLEESDMNVALKKALQYLSRS
ncbi:MAG: Holliday junction branch migration protein RuvA [Peptococcaceae bacterium]